ncbi:hypothetical protein KBZ20_15460 [Vulcanococcus limneticus Candia 3F8]|uniref:hypothetical protein n=1 Tax=Vulcanococcus limneticus TaxID=2170428 RepID=UPI0020CD4EFC|nr:hypothetical protein [Vulcanococcus limneticus]MCP9793165.1 hypothetical protein [Vulcanococcus limneticus MW73D5]MCP9895171.1 hypothetical protein [Vulcanococcus limneticus Candia 3F8]MCP9898563.1 hypothetical protein [Vulcanococcus limneticus Candia 3B3]
MGYSFLNTAVIVSASIPSASKNVTRSGGDRRTDERQARIGSPTSPQKPAIILALHWRTESQAIARAEQQTAIHPARSETAIDLIKSTEVGSPKPLTTTAAKRAKCPSNRRRLNAPDRAAKPHMARISILFKALKTRLLVL